MVAPWEKYEQAKDQANGKTNAPWAKYKDLKDQPNVPMPTSGFQSSLRGAEQGATLGFSDEIRGGLGALKDVATNDKYHLSDIVARYGVNRDEARAMLEKARQDNPASYAAGEVGGSIATSFLPGVGALGAAKGATVLARAARAAGGGGLLGGLTGLGTSQADLTKGNIDGAIDDVKSGAQLGAIAGGLMTPAFEGIGRGIKNFINPENLRGIAADRAVKATTGQNISALRKIAGATSTGQDLAKSEESLRRVGKDLIDSGVIGAGDKVEDLAAKLQTKRKEVGGQIGEVGKQIDTLYPKAVSSDNIANELLAYAESIPQTESGKKLREKIAKEAENFQAMKGVSFGDAQKIKNQFKYRPQDQDALISNQDVTNKIQRIISNEMDQTAKTVASTSTPESKALLDQYGDLKGKYRSFKLSSDAASDRALKNLSNRFVSPSDYGTGATGALLTSLGTGGAALPALAAGAVGAGLNKLARERGNSLAAVGFTKAAKAMENSPEFAKKFGNILYQSAERGGPALAVTHQLLSKKFPEYNQMLEQQD